VEWNCDGFKQGVARTNKKIKNNLAKRNSSATAKWPKEVCLADFVFVPKFGT